MSHSHRPGVEVSYNYVTEIHTDIELDVNQQPHSFDETFELVSFNEFQKATQNIFPRKEALTYWNSLFGNKPESSINGDNNPQNSFLTQASLKCIIEHHHLFRHGIDFQNLPKGFYIAKNPTSGIRNVLHYNEFIAKEAHKNPLAITLSQKKHEALKQHHFTSPKKEWYEFLQSKIKHNNETYCTQSELQDAFNAFCIKVESMGLKFYKPDFSSLPNDINPIVLLGRWNTVMCNPHLKKIDYQKQWEALPKLALAKSYGALRAITDYRHTQTPCSFVSQDMFVDDEYSFINTVKEDQIYYFHTLNRPNVFKYLAFQTKRNSIGFYESCLQTIEKMEIGGTYIWGSYKDEMLAILIRGSTGEGYRANTEAIEKEELSAWTALCQTIEGAPTSTWTMQAFVKYQGGNPDAVKTAFIDHLSRYYRPNIAYLKSIGDVISNHLQSLTILKAQDPLRPLEILSNQLNKLTEIYKNNFYHGARFYFINGKWPKNMDFKNYIELQDQLHREVVNYKDIFGSIPVALFSTFSLLTSQDVNQMGALSEGLYPESIH